VWEAGGWVPGHLIGKVDQLQYVLESRDISDNLDK